MKSVAYACPYVPPEWIAAHGLTPSRIMPASAGLDTRFQAAMGVCPYVAATADVAYNGDCDAMVLTTRCDQMRRMAERIELETRTPVFLLIVPHTPGAMALYKEDVQRLGRFLERMGGHLPSTEYLAEIMQRFDAERMALRGRTRTSSSGIPIALAGGPLTERDAALFRAIEEAGGDIALDATETGERTLPKPFRLKNTQENPFDILIDAYFNGIPDVFTRPNDRLYDWFAQAIETRGIRGIILHHYVWCDSWRIETQRLRERLGVPVLALDATGDGFLRAAGRIAAFFEVLR